MQQYTLSLDSVSCGPLQANCYVLTCPTSSQSIVIDPGTEPDKVLALIGDRQVTAILLTHGHADHVGAAGDVRAATGAPICIHPNDAHMLGQLSVDRWLSHGDTLMLGEHLLKVVHTPGHTSGQVSLLVPDEHAFVGDTIFEGGPGKTWRPEDFRTTLDTLKHAVLTWPDSMICYPGHGSPFRLGDIRAAITGFVTRQHRDDFYGDARWEE